mmetsp:Transcript_19425/g.61834  ORF Transcript_19425/g.61834 Transcript_19425/m.61834 type:complete len:203 (-) Transcript_19425:411-1019(-)
MRGPRGQEVRRSEHLPEFAAPNRLRGPYRVHPVPQGDGWPRLGREGLGVARELESGRVKDGVDILLVGTRGGRRVLCHHDHGVVCRGEQSWRANPYRPALHSVEHFSLGHSRERPRGLRKYIRGGELRYVHGRMEDAVVDRAILVEISRYSHLGVSYPANGRGEHRRGDVERADVESRYVDLAVTGQGHVFGNEKHPICGFV